MFSLKGRVALVTGASERARRAASPERWPTMAPRSRWWRGDGAPQGPQAESKKGGKRLPIEADVTDRAAMTRAFDAAEKAFGTVTILVNNAGIAHGGRAVEMPPEEWRQVLSTNLDAVFFWAQEAARRMLAAKKQGADRQYRFGARLAGRERRGRLCDRQGGRGAGHQGARGRTCIQGCARQCHCAGLVCYRDE